MCRARNRLRVKQVEVRSKADGTLRSLDMMPYSAHVAQSAIDIKYHCIGQTEEAMAIEIHYSTLADATCHFPRLPLRVFSKSGFG